MKYSFPVSWYFLFLTKRSFYLVFNKAATIFLKRISSLHKVWWKYKYKFSVCILYPFCSLHFVPSLHLYPVCSLQSAFCTDRIGIAVFVRASLKSRPEYWTSKKNLVRLSWPMCGLYVEELPRKSTMKEQWLLYTNWRRMQMHGWPIWLPLMLFHVITECVEMSPLRVP